MRTLVITAIVLIATAVNAQGVPPPPSSTVTPTAQTLVFDKDDPMSDDLRSDIRKVVLMPGESPTNEEVGGSYEKSTHGFYGGMAAGSGATTMHKQVGPVAVNFPIPIFQLPAMLAGGIAGATQREIQEFRDALTEELAQASSQQIVNEKIASDVYYEIRTAPNLDPEVFARETPVPDDTDGILYVSVRDVIIEIDGSDAMITAAVVAVMHRRSDEADVYETTIHYQDRDTLSNWTDNDNAVWKNFANFARHYVGREIAAQVFDSANVAHSLLPAKSTDVSVSKRNKWQNTSKKLSPTLAWELELTGSDDDPAWASGIDDSNIFYDVEIYDLQRPVYTAKQVRGPQHTITAQLEACHDYRWSVRPSYHVGGAILYGPWMRSGTSIGNGNVGQKASEAPAYLYDFAELEIKCGSK